MTRKQQIRTDFREAVFALAKFRCAICGFASTPERADDELDAHHITPREKMPAGGYVVQNGVALCKAVTGRTSCHWRAERALSVAAEAGMIGRQDHLWPYAPEQLYAAIKSSREQAEIAARRQAELLERDP